MSEDVEDEQEITEDAVELEIVFEVPVADGGDFTYVCSECGNGLTEIPFYNRYYCGNCGLHY